MAEKDFGKIHNKMVGQIERRQRKLKSLDSKNFLLPLVTIIKHNIDYTSQFSVAYTGMTMENGLRQYIKDLSTEIMANS